MTLRLQSSRPMVSMSKQLGLNFAAFQICFCLIGFCGSIAGQGIEARIAVNDLSQTVSVQGAFLSDAEGVRNLSFADSSLGTPGLGLRVSKMVLHDRDGNALSFRRFTAGEFASEREIRGFQYEVDLKQLENARSDAHVSWSGGNRTLIFTDDILPRALGRRSPYARLELSLGGGTRIFTSANRISETVFELVDRRTGLFWLDRSGSTGSLESKGRNVNAALSGEWHFSEKELISMADAIFERYAAGFGGAPAARARVLMLRSGRPGLPVGTWEARTVGNTVLIVSTDMPFRIQSLQRLHEQLRHELFHIWIPNGVRLVGNYDWFFEGFALYHSLKIGVEMNRLTFNDMLDTLSRAYKINKDSGRLSLQELSAERWRGNETLLYARGMLIAFHTDVLLMERSGGKVSVETLLKRLFSEYRDLSVPSDAPSAVKKLLSDQTSLADLVRENVDGNGPFSQASILELSGLEVSINNGHESLRVRTSLNGRQRAMLDRLGYNNWRKFRK